MKQPEHYAKELDQADLPINILRTILQVSLNLSAFHSNSYSY